MSKKVKNISRVPEAEKQSTLVLAHLGALEPILEELPLCMINELLVAIKLMKATLENKVGKPDNLSVVTEIVRGETHWHYAGKPLHAVSPRDLLEGLKPGVRVLILAPEKEN